MPPADKLLSLDWLPNKKSALLFAVLALLGGLLLKIPFLREGALLVGFFLGSLALFASPALPLDLANSVPRTSLRQIAAITFPMTLFFCLVMNGLITWIFSKTFVGSDNSRIYYLDDYHNMFLYATIVPLYVTCSICLLQATRRGWFKLKKAADDAQKLQGAETEKFSILRFASFIFLSLLITGLLITNFVDDLIDPTITKKVYWFVSLSPSGDRTLNSAGSYYLIMNATLLFLTIVAAFCYLSMSIETIRLGRCLEQSEYALPISSGGANNVEEIQRSENRLVEELSDFCWCYLLCKIAIIAYAINVLVWSSSDAGIGANIDIAIVALALIGLIIIPTPRLYIEYRWGRLKAQGGAAYRDFRNHRQQIVSHALNSVSAFLIFYILDRRLELRSISWSFMKTIVSWLSG